MYTKVLQMWFRAQNQVVGMGDGLGADRRFGCCEIVEGLGVPRLKSSRVGLFAKTRGEDAAPGLEFTPGPEPGLLSLTRSASDA